METTKHPFPWLDLMDRPAFCVKDGIVVAANSLAQRRMLRLGMDVREIITDHRDIYETFQNGCLYLTVTVGEIPCNASITRTEECDVFLLQQDSDDDQLQALALAAQQLRIPLANVMTVADRLMEDFSNSDSQAQHQVSQINHNLFQLLRIISNMSDASSYKRAPFAGMQTVNLTAVIEEIMEKVQTVSADTGISISYTGPDTQIFGLASEEKLERAIYNLLSNGLKFSPQGSTIDVKLTKNGNLLSFTVCNQNLEVIHDHSFWSQYRREPSIEDSRFGLGLGMTLVSSVASAHGGTVLVDHPTPQETRVTMSILINKDNSGPVRSPAFRIGDYAGGRDKGLLELAEILPTDAYKNIN